MRRTCGFLVLVALLASCAHKPVPVATALTLGQFWEEQKIRVAKAERFTGKISLRLESKTEKVSGSGRVAGARENAVRLELRDPLGRTQYVLNGMQGTVQVYVPSAKTFYRDVSGGRTYFKKVLGHGLSVHELREVWFGIAPLKSGTILENWHWDSERGGFSASSRIRDGSIDLLLDGDCGAIRELKVATKEGSYLVEYSDFEAVENVHFAHEVALTVAKTGEKAILGWDDLVWNFKGEIQALSKMDVDPGTKTIELH